MTHCMVRIRCGLAISVGVFCYALMHVPDGDLMRSEKLVIDKDDKNIVRYVEVLVGRRKTMHSQQHKHAFLPMVAPACGIDPKPWADRWLQLRRELQIKLPPHHPIMPAPDQWGIATDRPIETAEAVPCSARFFLETSHMCKKGELARTP